MWYARDKQTAAEAAQAAREEIEKVKQEEEEAMRELLGLAPRREVRPRGSHLDKREQEELFKRGKAAEEVDPTYAQGERVQGLGYAPAPKNEVPNKKDLLQMEGSPAESPGDPLVGQSNGREMDREIRSSLVASREVHSPSVSDDEDAKKRKRKEEKRAAKDKRKEEKRAAKQLRREKGEMASRGRDRSRDDKQRREDSDSSNEKEDRRDLMRPTSHWDEKNWRHSVGHRGEKESEKRLKDSHNPDEDDLRVRERESHGSRTHKRKR
jgi:ubiquitin